MELVLEQLQGIPTIYLIQLVFWLLAGVISFIFSLGNARIWTSISMGFFLILVSQFYLLNKLFYTPTVATFTYITGTVAIMLITHGFLEYYVFCRTFEITGRKQTVYLSTMLLLLLSWVFLSINPEPSMFTVRNVKMVENAIWVFLTLMNLEIIRKIYFSIRDSAIAKAFICFGVVFVLIFLWKGSELYLQVFQWDRLWGNIAFQLDLDELEFDHAIKLDDSEDYWRRISFARQVYDYAGMLAAMAVSGTFAFLYRLLK
ncbi:hypothetical protein [Trichlorobacter sp.]|uniref:hypothetical protein n=1 Tax=Trichlorobacter sp. TaxID=2911007 RepID=UPI002A36F88F|nr:hypothetical protein [Trichlorobacter sp.]MDY0383910.1 hypothetical protein [Trichlorobacter sp.]